MGFLSDFRAACLSLLRDYAADAGVKLTAYPGRPRSIHAPHAFVDVVRETIRYSGPTIRQRTPQADLILVHGSFDSEESTTQADDFIDGFADWCLTRYHEAGANTLIAVVESEGIPTFVPDWLPDEERKTYYATRITMEGYSG